VKYLVKHIDNIHIIKALATVRAAMKSNARMFVKRGRKRRKKVSRLRDADTF
jgi:hypothetical protein